MIASPKVSAGGRVASVEGHSFRTPPPMEAGCPFGERKVIVEPRKPSNSHPAHVARSGDPSVPTNRRTFIKASAAVAGALSIDGLPRIALGATPDAASSPPVERARKPLSILILGGTGFTGPEQVEYAIARGHSVTLINRNKTRPDFFKGRVEQLIGDLNGDMSALKGRKFDVVIDNPTTAPAWVRNAAQYLAGNTNHYIFISTISAYANDKTAWADESDSTHELPAGLDPFVDITTLLVNQRGSYYGPL